MDTISPGTQSIAQPEAATPQPRLINTFLAHSGWVYSFAFSGDGYLLATTSDDRTAKVWNWKVGIPVLEIGTDDPYFPFSWAALSPDRKTIATSRADGAIQLRAIDTGSVQQTLPEPSNGSGIVMFVATGGGTGAAPAPLLVDATGIGQNFRIKLWDLTTLKARTLSRRWTNLTAITPDGGFLVAASSYGTAIVWDLLSAAPVVAFPQGATTGATAIAISTDGLTVIAALKDRVEQWNARTGSRIRTLFTSSAKVKALAISPNGAMLAVNFGNYIQLRSLLHNRALYNLPYNAVAPQQIMSFSPDGRYFLNTDMDGDRIRVWQLP